ncbi:MAG TPA: hypothetical protein VGT44_16045 [Ktedonobacteraceae bacterium]|nr:hypothetical protein [Ktedonobacteraceae bacterium]
MSRVHEKRRIRRPPSFTGLVIGSIPGLLILLLLVGNLIALPAWVINVFDFIALALGLVAFVMSFILLRKEEHEHHGLGLLLTSVVSVLLAVYVLAWSLTGGNFY